MSLSSPGSIMCGAAATHACNAARAESATLKWASSAAASRRGAARSNSAYASGGAHASAYSAIMVSEAAVQSDARDENSCLQLRS